MSATQLRSLPICRHSNIRPPNTVRIYIGQALVDSCSFREACDAIFAHAASDGSPAYIITPNAQHVVLLNGDSRLREIYQHADLVVPDGISLLFAARVFGRAFPERITGVDLFQSLCGMAASAGLRVFLLGGAPSSAGRAAACLRGRYPGLDVQTYCPPPGFEKDSGELEKISETIRAATPHLLFVGLGAPKQEYWIYDHGRHLGVSICMGIGGSFEMVSGIFKRAPHWVRTLGCEWLYRLCLEPRRLWRRYLIGNSQFIRIVLHQRMRRALFSALVRILKSADLESGLQDAELYSDAMDILCRAVSLKEAENR